MIMDRIGYQFKDESLLELALSHRSVGSINNERLEFIGDSLINCIIAMELYALYPKATEGQLTRMRAQLVCAEMLGKISKELKIGDDVILGPGELRSGGHQRKSILSDSIEAIIGAIYLDSGKDFNILRETVLPWFDGKFDNVEKDLKDSKTVLQEYLQAQKMPLPTYEVLQVEGEQHAQTFHVQCTVELLSESVTGIGNSRRKAEQMAAELILEKINENS